MSYPPPPMPQFAAQGPIGPQRLRGRIPLILSAIFGVVGAALVVIGIVLVVHNFFDRIDGFTRVPIGASGRTVHLDAGHYVGYLETPGSGGTGAGVHLDVRGIDVTEPPGVGTYGDTVTYDWHGKHGSAVFTIDINQSGSYHVTVTSDFAPSGSVMAIGPSIASGIVVGVVLIVPGALLFVAAIVLLIVGLVIRSGSKKQIANAAMFGGYGGGFPPAGPPGGYPIGGPPPGGPPTTL